MALGDWTRNIYAPTYHSVYLDVNTPLVGNGSAVLDTLPNDFTAFGGINMYYAAADGYVKGRIRTLMRMDIRPSSYPFDRGGIICMQSDLNPAVNQSSWYAFSWGVDKNSTAGTPGQQYWQIEKHVNDRLHQSAGTTILDTSSVTSSDGDYYPVQADWVYDVPNLGGTRLTLSVGTLNSLDFSTLDILLDVIDTSSPLGTSVQQGLFIVQMNTAAGGGSRYTFDETSISELV